jgi:hypothetical protein
MYGKVQYIHTNIHTYIHMYWCVQCNMMKTVLPKDQWPTYEEDRQKGRYVRGIVSLQFGAQTGKRIH